MPSLSAWTNFYVITGSSAGALTGLMFVVITLIANGGVRASGQQTNAFGTPTIVHFGVALFLSAALNAPWRSLPLVGLVLSLTGLGGLAYATVAALRTRRQHDYNLVLEDRLFHVIFPLITYAALLVAAIPLPGNPTPALFCVAAVTLALLFIGIHNAWDTVTYITFEFLRKPDAPGAAGEPDDVKE